MDWCEFVLSLAPVPRDLAAINVDIMARLSSLDLGCSTRMRMLELQFLCYQHCSIQAYPFWEPRRVILCDLVPECQVVISKYRDCFAACSIDCSSLLTSLQNPLHLEFLEHCLTSIVSEPFSPWSLQLLRCCQSSEHMETILSFILVLASCFDSSASNLSPSFVSRIFVEHSDLAFSGNCDKLLAVLFALSVSRHPLSMEISEFQDLLEVFSSDSYGSESLQWIIVHFLRMDLSSAFRECFWKDLKPLLPRVIFKAPASKFIKWMFPVETNQSLLQEYLGFIGDAFSTAQDSFLYKVAIHHASHFIFSDFQADNSSLWVNEKGSLVDTLLNKAQDSRPLVDLISAMEPLQYSDIVEALQRGNVLSEGNTNLL